MTNADGFTSIAEVVADDRARLPLAKFGVHKNDRYAASVNADGAILLTPVVSIPKRELILWESDGLRASVLRGLADTAEGNTRPLDWATAD